LDGTSLDQCFGGANSMALMADCNGSIVLVTMNGSALQPGYEYEWIQVFQLTQDTLGNVVPVMESHQRNYTGLFQTDNSAFRWAAGAYVSESGIPVLFSTERRTNNGDNNYVDGKLYF